MLSLSSNKRRFFRVNFLINSGFEDLRIRRLFHFSLPKCGVYRRAAFKRGNTVWVWTYTSYWVEISWFMWGYPGLCGGISWLVWRISWFVWRISWCVWGISWFVWGISWFVGRISSFVWGISWFVLGYHDLCGGYLDLRGGYLDLCGDILICMGISWFVWGYLDLCGGYLDLCGGYLDSLICVEDIMSTFGDVQCIKEISWVHYGRSVISPQCTEYRMHWRYAHWWYRLNALNTLQCTAHVIQGGTNSTDTKLILDGIRQKNLLNEVVNWASLWPFLSALAVDILQYLYSSLNTRLFLVLVKNSHPWNPTFHFLTFWNLHLRYQTVINLSLQLVMRHWYFLHYLYCYHVNVLWIGLKEEHLNVHQWRKEKPGRFVIVLFTRLLTLIQVFKFNVWKRGSGA